MYHAKFAVSGVQLITGGYLGVDIFFVLSGYLITTILMNELADTQRISILGFYERRVRRLMPALILVMLVSLPFAWDSLLPNQLIDYAKSIVFSLFFSSNFYWDLSLQQYGAESSLLTPFLHTWSLAVEEQYYIVFPLLLAAIYKWARSYLTSILALFFALSLLLAEWMSGVDPSFSFYMMPTRFWELLSGSLLAILLIKRSQLTWSTRLQATMPAVGLLLVIASLCLFDIETRHPGFLTLIPILGTVLIVCFSGGSDWVTKLLSNRAMVYIGLISYSLYLWHYPIFAFGRLNTLQPTLSDKIVWIILTFALSALSYHLVEKPFRNRKTSTRRLFSALIPVTCIVLFTCFFWIGNQGVLQRGDYLQDLVQRSFPRAMMKDGIDCHSGGPTRSAFEVSESCQFMDFPGAPTLVLLGDSHARVLAWPIKELAQTNGLNFVQITEAGCSHIVSSDKSRCRTRAKAIRAFLRGLSSPMIIYNARLPLFLEQERFNNQEGEYEQGYLAINKEEVHAQKAERSASIVTTLESWLQDGYKLCIVYPMPEQGFHVIQKLKSSKPKIMREEQLPTLSTSYVVYKERVASSYAALDKVSGSQVTRVYPERSFCHEETGRCIASEGENLYFGYDNHVSHIGALLVAREIADVMGLRIPKSFLE